MTLKDLRIGQVATVKSINIPGNNRKKLIDMGFTEGIEVEMVRVAPFGCPIEVKIRGYHLSLRANDAENIIVEGTKKSYYKYYTTKKGENAN